MCRPGTPIDTEARLRGTSAYFPDRAIPMLPLELSTGLCSLNPKLDRLCVSALLEIDHSGDVVRQEFVRGVMRSVERMTYTDVHLLLEGDAGLQRALWQSAGAIPADEGVGADPESEARSAGDRLISTCPSRSSNLMNGGR